LRRLHGFTLIELAMVLAIMSLLVMVTVPAYQGILLRSRAVEARGMLEAVADAELRYYRDHGRYLECPPSSTTVPRGVTVAFDPEAPGWKELGVNLGAAVRYRYEVAVDGDSFTVTAQGDLDGDGKASRFALHGKTLPLTVQDERE